MFCSLNMDDLDAIEKETSSVHPRHDENRAARGHGFWRKESQNGVTANGVTLSAF